MLINLFKSYHFALWEISRKSSKMVQNDSPVNLIGLACRRVQVLKDLKFKLFSYSRSLIVSFSQLLWNLVVKLVIPFPIRWSLLFDSFSAPFGYFSTPFGYFSTYWPSILRFSTLIDFQKIAVDSLDDLWDVKFKKLITHRTPVHHATADKWPIVWES